MVTWKPYMDLDLDWVDGTINDFEQNVCDVVTLAHVDEEPLEGRCVYSADDCFIMKGDDGYLIVLDDEPITVERVTEIINRIV
jgi:hypothetical protein